MPRVEEKTEARMEQGRRREDLEALETELLLEAIHRHYGFDFRNYAQASLKRRVWKRMTEEGLTTVSALIEKVLHDTDCMERFLLDLSINVTSMFRDPTFYLALRQKVIPLLRTYPYLRIWDAGCSTGEEVYSLAILLEEEEIYDRCRIYATDMNELVLAKAKAGIFPLAAMQENTSNYLEAGGTGSFSQYYTAAYEGAIFRPALRRNIIFAQHNLATDSSFNEFHLVLCRNVLIYFDNVLQERVQRLFKESLVKFGVLGLGKKETLKFAAIAECFEEVDGDEKIYRRVR
jgi:chemotaxis protein methyltransferase CheR